MKRLLLRFICWANNICFKHGTPKKYGWAVVFNFGFLSKGFSYWDRKWYCDLCEKE